MYKLRFIFCDLGHLDSRFIDGIVALNVLTVDGVPGCWERRGEKR